MLKALYSTLVEICDSKKALVMVASLLAAGTSRLHWDVSADAILPYLGLAATYILGQGIADHGKEAAKVSATADAPGSYALASQPKSPQGGFVSYMLLPLIALAFIGGILAIGACLSSSQKKAGEHAALSCALDAVSPHVQPIEDALKQSDYKTALAQLKLPAEAIDCGIKTILAVFTASPTSEPSPLVLHGREWLAEHAQ